MALRWRGARRETSKPSGRRRTWPSWSRTRARLEDETSSGSTRSWCGWRNDEVAAREMQREFRLAGGGPRVGSGHWNLAENRKKFMDTVAVEYGIHQPRDWARVSSRAVREMGGSGLLSRYSYSLFAALNSISAGSSLVRRPEQVEDRLHRVECLWRNLDEQSVPARHCAIP